MTLEVVFSIANTIAMLGWVVLVFLPNWRYTSSLVTSILIPGLLGFVYAYLIVTEFGKTEGGFGSLAQVALLFQNPAALLAGWIHYLAFDLFVGSWEVRDAQRHGINRLLVVPCLFLTFMFGPIGLLLYLTIRYFSKKQLLIEVSHA
jgi:ABA DEFICIENT 4-like